MRVWGFALRFKQARDFHKVWKTSQSLYRGICDACFGGKSDDESDDSTSSTKSVRVMGMSDDERSDLVSPEPVWSRGTHTPEWPRASSAEVVPKRKPAPPTRRAEDGSDLSDLSGTTLRNDRTPPGAKSADSVGQSSSTRVPSSTSPTVPHSKTAGSARGGAKRRHSDSSSSSATRAKAAKEGARARE